MFRRHRLRRRYNAESGRRYAVAKVLPASQDEIAPSSSDGVTIRGRIDLLLPRRAGDLGMGFEDVCRQRSRSAGAGPPVCDGVCGERGVRPPSARSRRA